jgi:hypothetical protein
MSFGKTSDGRLVVNRAEVIGARVIGFEAKEGRPVVNEGPANYAMPILTRSGKIVSTYATEKDAKKALVDLRLDALTQTFGKTADGTIVVNRAEVIGCSIHKWHERIESEDGDD